MNKIWALGVFAVVTTLAVRAQDPAWRQWRGPARDGHVPAGAAPEEWPEELAPVWQIEVGEGHASPVVDGDRVFALTRRGGDEVVTALDVATGEVVWQHAYPAEIGINQYADGHGRWPRATPLLHDGVLVTLGASATLSAWDAASGVLRWRRIHEGGVDTSQMFCGTAGSPLLDAGRVVCHLGDDSGGELLAVQLEDGAEVWRTELEGPGYASPVRAVLDGVPQLVTLTMSRVVGVGLDDGEVLWSAPFADKWNENIVTPVVHDGLVVVSGVRNGTRALRPRAGTDGWSVATAWAARGTTLYMSSPVAHDGVLFGFSQKRRGSFVALSLEDGSARWSEPHEADNAALLWSGDLLLALNTGGQLCVGRADRDGLSLERRYAVAESATWAHPVPLPDGVLVKDATHLRRWRAAPQ